MLEVEYTDTEKLRDEVAELRGEVAALTSSIKDLVTAWNAAGAMVAFTKWAAGLATVLLGAWIALQKLKDM